MEDGKEGLMSAAEDIIASLEAKDPEALMHALSSFFQICDSEPHEEGEHMNSGGLVEDTHWMEGPVDSGPHMSAQRKQRQYFGEY